MTWWHAIPLIGVAAAYLFLPGALLVLASPGRRLPWPVALAAAPLVSVALTGTTALAAGALGIPWRWWSVPAAAAFLAALLLAARALRPPPSRPAGTEPRKSRPLPRAARAALPFLLGWTAGAVLTAHTLWRAMDMPDWPNQIWDAVFHYNATRFALETQDASSLNLLGFMHPDKPGLFYPGAWHALAAQTSLATGAGVVPAGNMVVFAVGALVWPFTCVALAAQVLGSRTVPLAVAGLASTGFWAFPFKPLLAGALFPNMLGVALLPAALAVAHWLARLSGSGRSLGPAGRGSSSRRARILLASPWVRFAPLWVAALAALGFSHPNTLFSLVVLAAPLLLGVVAGKARLLGGRARAAAAAVVLLTFAALAAAWHFLSQRYLWEASESPQQAAGEWLLATPNNSPTSFPLVLLVLAGLVLAVRAPGLRWLAAAHGLMGFFFVVAAGWPSGWFRSYLTGVWYNDSPRLAAVLPVTAVLLAAVAADRAQAALAARGLWPTASRAGSPSASPVRPGAWATAATALVLLLASPVWLRGAAFTEEARILHDVGYEPSAEAPMVSDDELRLFRDIERIVPPGAVVANNPYNGSALLYAYTGRAALFPMLGMVFESEERGKVARELRAAATDPAACAAAQDLGVEYVADFGDRFTTAPMAEHKPTWDDYPGVTGLEPSGFLKLVASHGQARLFQVGACSR